MHGSTSCRFQNKQRFWSQNAFFLPHLFNACHYGVMADSNFSVRFFTFPLHIMFFFLKQVYIARGFPSGIPFLTALQESVRGLGWPLDLLLAPIRCRYRQLQPLHYMPVPLHYIKQKEFAQLYYSHHRPTVLETVSNSSLYQRLSENQRSMQTHSRLC